MPASLTERFAPFLESVLAESGALIRGYFLSADLGIDTKSDKTPATAADRGAEELLRKRILAEFPDHGIIGEEFGRHNAEAEYVWVLDPIDGTKAFIHGVPLFTTLVGVQRRGRPIFGAIHQPVANLLCMGDGARTTLNGAQVRVRPAPSIAECSVLASSCEHVAPRWSEAGFNALRAQAKLFRTWGDGYGYLLLAAGLADVMLDPIMNYWDMVALIPIIEGAGGTITAWDGSDPLVSCSTVATAGPLHGEVLRILKGE